MVLIKQFFVGCLCPSRNNPVCPDPFLHTYPWWTDSYRRYLLNGNILAAKTFISHFTSAAFQDPPLRPIKVGTTDEVVITRDSVVNFAQMAVLTCQRAQGDKNKVMRESWVRLCGTYQSRGGLLAQPEVRRVRRLVFFKFLCFFADILIV